MNEPERDHHLIVTGDGSHTIFVPALQEHYHSTYGALAESRHIFINAGFEVAALQFDQVNILEVGFGTGLNALLTFLRAEELMKEICYTGIESTPVDPALLSRINHVQALAKPGAAAWWNSIHHEAQWNLPFRFANGSTLLKWEGMLQDYEPKGPKFHLVYFDAFGPSVQPELWEDAIFLKLAAMVVEDGILVTYSAKGAVRRALVAAGFRVEKIPGPAGKREMVRAIRLKSDINE
jgi:tRNA U34 5-methylaminomethyl-2-thiouridine-forming methyltransferase MnmC